MKHAFAGLVALVALIAAPLSPAQGASPDKVALDQLASAGSDLQKLHQFEFTLHFPTQKAAEGAETRLVPLAFQTKVMAGKTSGDWIVQGTKKLYPVESDLSGLRDKLNAVAAQGKGTYEGWRAKAIN